MPAPAEPCGCPPGPCTPPRWYIRSRQQAGLGLAPARSTCGGRLHHRRSRVRRDRLRPGPVKWRILCPIITPLGMTASTPSLHAGWFLSGSGCGIVNRQAPPTVLPPETLTLRYRPHKPGHGGACQWWTGASAKGTLLYFTRSHMPSARLSPLVKQPLPTRYRLLGIAGHVLLAVGRRRPADALLQLSGAGRGVGNRTGRSSAYIAGLRSIAIKRKTNSCAITAWPSPRIMLPPTGR